MHNYVHSRHDVVFSLTDMLPHLSKSQTPNLYTGDIRAYIIGSLTIRPKDPVHGRCLINERCD